MHLLNQSQVKLTVLIFLLLFANIILAHDNIKGFTAKINEVDIYYELDGSGLPIMLMHGGLGADHWTFHWPGAIPPLANTYKLVYYDHRANGRSGGTPDTVTFSNLIKDAEVLRQTLGLGKVVVLGHSYGGLIALYYAVSYPNSIAGLILYSTAPNFFNAFKGNLPPDLENRKCPSANYYFSEEKCLEVEAKDQTIKKFTTWYACYNEENTFDMTPNLKEIKVPTLILAGKYDFVFPISDQEKMDELIPNSWLVIFEKSGHSSHIEEPETFQNAIRKFLGTTGIYPGYDIVTTWGTIKK